MLLALALAALTLTGTVRVRYIFVLAALLGTVNAFDIPARQSFIVEMVGRTDLMNAIALNSSMFNASRIIGPAIAGILVARIGEGWCFFGNGVSYLAVIAGLLLMRVAPREAQPAGSPLRRLAEGFRYVAGNLPVRSLLGLLAVVSLTGMPYTVLMPIFADRILHGGAAALGNLMGATGIGALMGAMLLATRRNLQGFGRGVAVAAATFGASVAAFSFSHTYWLSMGILVIGGVFDDGADGRHEHADPEHGAGSAARPGDVHLLDDVHGDGAIRVAAGGMGRGAVRSAGDGGGGRGGLHGGSGRVHRNPAAGAQRSAPIAGRAAGGLRQLMAHAAGLFPDGFKLGAIVVKLGKIRHRDY